jgi:deoxyribodipyrimidine photo-lyase
MGVDYPLPIVNVDETRKKASDIVWGFKNKKEVKTEGVRIVKKHVNSKLKSVIDKKQ